MDSRACLGSERVAERGEGTTPWREDSRLNALCCSSQKMGCQTDKDKGLGAGVVQGCFQEMARVQRVLSTRAVSVCMGNEGCSKVLAKTKPTSISSSLFFFPRTSQQEGAL